MKDYVIINGVSSLTITGLAISQLPPISKPPMRTMIEEIDGRNGDLITELGYGAYDKELTIGLYGNYNVDNVIKFFNQEGEIVFSNEPTKYYNFKIINQIDYESLVKFRTATITIHCQPFKYPLNETPSIIQFNTATISNVGNIYAKPTIGIVGTGTIRFYCEGVQYFEVDMSNDNEIIIDTEKMEAYDTNGILKNRQVKGDYNKFRFEVGSNNITIAGSFTSVKITKKSRWL